MLSSDLTRACGSEGGMPLPRLRLFELEDLAWFPSLIRDLATDYLRFMEMRLDLHKPVAPLLERAI